MRITYPATESFSALCRSSQNAPPSNWCFFLVGFVGNLNFAGARPSSSPRLEMTCASAGGAMTCARSSGSSSVT